MRFGGKSVRDFLPLGAARNMKMPQQSSQISSGNSFPTEIILQSPQATPQLNANLTPH